MIAPGQYVVLIKVGVLFKTFPIPFPNQDFGKYVFIYVEQRTHALKVFALLWRQ